MSLRIQWRMSTTDSGTITAAFVPNASQTGDSWGVRRVDTSEVLVNSGTALSTDGSGTFYYDLEEPESGLVYEFWIQFTSSNGHVWYINDRVRASMSSSFTFGTWGYVKKLYLQQGGRRDRVQDYENDDYTDRTCNDCGNIALDWIDQQIRIELHEQWSYHDLAANDAMLQLEKLLYVNGVYLQDNENADDYGRYPRIRLPWWIVRCGLSPAQQDETALTITDAQDIVFGDTHWAVNAIYLPPSDEDRRIVVVGQYYSPRVLLDSDVNYWTYNHPGMLVNAMRRQDEIEFRNDTGTNFFEGVLNRDLAKLHSWNALHKLESGITGRKLVG